MQYEPIVNPGCDGLLQIPDLPGLGLDWNEDAAKAHAFER